MLGSLAKGIKHGISGIVVDVHGRVRRRTGRVPLNRSLTECDAEIGPRVAWG
jgi:hypothetical protein